MCLCVRLVAVALLPLFARPSFVRLSSFVFSQGRDLQWYIKESKAGFHSLSPSLLFSLLFSLIRLPFSSPFSSFVYLSSLYKVVWFRKYWIERGCLWVCPCRIRELRGSGGRGQRSARRLALLVENPVNMFQRKPPPTIHK